MNNPWLKKIVSRIVIPAKTNIAPAGGFGYYGIRWFIIEVVAALSGGKQGWI